MNQLFYGDNLHVLREHIADESVDLIYLDPPFNSKRDYNLLFKTPKGHQSDAQIEAFKDSWSWGTQAETELEELTKQKNTDVALVVNALVSFLGKNDMMAYLVMMASRLLELRRVLKSTGSLYLHCDPSAAHYLKIILDGVFGKENFANEIIWKRTTTKNDYKQGAVNWPRVHDVILLYHRSTDEAREAGRFHQSFEPYDEKTIETFYNFKDPDGRRYRLSDLTAPGQGSRGHPQYEFKGVTRFWRYNQAKMEQLDAEGRIQFRPHGGVPRLKVYLEDAPGIATGDVWTDVRGMHNLGTEMLGYPTQKPLALLERIILASSDEGDVVLDPFCGCGTAVHGAQKLKRRWIGIDITHLAISLIEKRLKDAFGKRCKYEVHGTPKDLDAARDLARRDKYQFQYWAVSLVEAQPTQGKKKGADGGIDGLKFFRDLAQKDVCKVVVSVKGGENLKADDIRSLMAVREREGAEVALFVSLEEPTKGMVKDAASAGLYTSPNGKQYPRVQLLTIHGLLSGAQRPEHPDYEPDLNFTKAKPEATGAQQALL